MSAHTPGPWHVVMSNNATPIINHDFGFDWTDPQELGSRVCAMPAEITHTFNSLANARLIAAAPELLEALILLEAEMVASGNARATDFGWPAAIEKTRAAIAKATGAAA